MKRVSILVLVVVALVVALASCATTPAHTHTYGTEFKYNETQHWIGATCTEAGCADVKIAAANHFDKNEDGFCDACAYDLGHEHTYDTAWESDDTHHWHAANCGCADVAPADKAEHDVNDLGVCEVCDKLVAAPDVTTVEKAIAVGASQRGQVVSGSVQQTSDYSGSYTLYTYAPDYTLYIGAGSELWLSKSGDEYVGVQVAYGEVSKYDYEDVEQLMTEGYLYDGQFIGYYDTFYGAENLVKGLYEIASIDDAAANLVANVSDGVYSFTFDLCGYEEIYDDDGTILGTVVNSITKVSVTFTLADTYYIDSITVNTARYFQVETVEGKASIVEGAEPDSKYSVTVVQDTALWDNIYTAERMEFASFELVDEYDQPIAEKITVELGSPALYVYFTNVLPITANISFDAPEVTVEDYAFNNYVNAQDGYVVFYPGNADAPGTYTVTIATANVTKTFEVEVVVPELEYVNASGVIEETDWWGDTYYVLGDLENATVTAGEEFLFTAMANNPFCDNTVTVVITDADGNVVDVTLGETTEWVEVNYESSNVTFKTVTFDAAGTYTVTLTSTVNENLTDSFTVTVEAAAGGDDTGATQSLKVAELDGVYNINFIMDGIFVLTFNAAEGTLNIVDNNNGKVSGDYTYIYDANTDAMIVYDGVGDEVAIYITTGLDGNATFQCEGLMMPQPLVATGAADGGDDGDDTGATQSLKVAELDGVYNINFIMDGIFVLTFNAAEGTLNIVDNNNGKVSGDYTYIYDANTDAMIVYDGVGDEVAIYITTGMDGNATFQCEGLMMPQPLVAAN